MIRITYKDSDDNLDNDLFYGFINYDIPEVVNERGEVFNLNAILKIEKQVKDLTIEEVNKLMLNGIEPRVQDAKIIISIWDYGYDEEGNHYHDWKDLSDNDYIDITDLVKEQGND